MEKAKPTGNIETFKRLNHIASNIDRAYKGAGSSKEVNMTALKVANQQIEELISEIE